MLIVLGIIQVNVKVMDSLHYFSTAITQAPEAFLIRALKHAANGEFFRVTERVGLDLLQKNDKLFVSTENLLRKKLK